MVFIFLFLFIVFVVIYFFFGLIYIQNNQFYYRNWIDKDFCSEGVELIEFIIKILENIEFFLGVRFLGFVIFVYC